VRQAAFLIGMKDTLSEFPVSSDSVFLLPPGRAKGDSVGDSLWVVYRVTDRNDRYIPTFAEAKARAESLVAEDERAVQLSEARTYFEAHASDYEIPQQYTIRYVLFARPPRDSIRVSDEDLKAYYDANLARYQRAEEVRARHLLVKVDAKANAATWAKAEDKARKLRAQLAGGADFAALVERHTDDTGTKERGGDLGFFARGQMVGPFEEAAFQLQPGELSGVVKTQYGYHILRVEEKRPAGPKPFEEVRAEIQQALVQPKQDEIAREEAEAFLKKLTGPDSLEAQAGTRKVKDSSPFAKGQPIPELGYVAQVDSVLESLKAGETGRMPARVWNGYIVFQMKEITPKHIPAFEEIKEKAARDYDRFRRNELARTEADAVRTRIQQGVSWEEAGANYGAPQTTDFFARAGSIRGLGQAAELGEQPFVLKPGDLSEVITLRSGFAFFKVAERKEADLELFAEQRKGLRETLFRERYAEWYAGLKTKAKIVIHVRELKEEEQQPRPGIPGLPPGLGG
jgi:peptidyl-prolyl cis-trans isomerase D